MKLLSTTLRLDSGISLPGEGRLEIAAEIIAPDAPSPSGRRWPEGPDEGVPPIALVCLPGGGMTRGYFDLKVPQDDSFSFARQMVGRGYICVLMDHLGVGESTRPADGYALSADLVMRANAHATAQVLERLREGTARPGLAAQPKLISIGVGHSMGAMLTIMQQAEFRQHRAIAVLGFSTRGLPEYLPSAVKELAKDHAAARREAPRLAQALFREPYPNIGRSADGNQLYASAKAEPAGVAAIKWVRTQLLPVPAYLAMLPGNVAPEAARITVPVFVGLGDRDMAGPPHEAPTAFTASPQVTLEVLPDTGHSHFLFPGRRQLFERLQAWIRRLL